jgi:hypothetical protein
MPLPGVFKFQGLTHCSVKTYLDGPLSIGDSPPMPSLNKLLGLTSALSIATLAHASEGEGVAPAAAKLVDLRRWLGDHQQHGNRLGGLRHSHRLDFAGVRKPQLLPTKAQSVFESLLEALRDLFEPIVGKKAFPGHLPAARHFFCFYPFSELDGAAARASARSAGRRGFSDGHEEFTPWIRPFTSDFNGTIALALVSFGAWLIMVLKYAGPKLILWDLFGNKAEKSETPAGSIRSFPSCSSDRRFHRGVFDRHPPVHPLGPSLRQCVRREKICSTAPASSSSSISWSSSSA